MDIWPSSRSSRTLIRRLTPILHEGGLRIYIMAVRQMRLIDMVATLTDVVACVTVGADFVRRDIAYRLPVIWVAKEDHGVDKLRCA